MALSEADIERYARQVIIPAVGVNGQEALLAGRVLLLGDPTGLAQARRYLEAAGLQTTRDPAEPVDCVVVADCDALSDAERDLVTGREIATAWYQLRGHRLCAGVARARQRVVLPPAANAELDDREWWPLLHDVAACDVACAAIALVLGWPIDEPAWQIDLA